MRCSPALARLLALVVLWLAAPGVGAGAVALAAPPAVTVEDLLVEPGVHAGELIVVRGELVGDFGKRDDGTVWTQLNGDPYVDAPLLGGGDLAGANIGVGVRFAAGVWPGFEDPGGYRVRGPVVEVTGIWRYHDPGRGGESYLDATAVALLHEARALSEQVNWLPLGLGAGLLGAAALLVGWRRRRAG